MIIAERYEDEILEKMVEQTDIENMQKEIEERVNALKSKKVPKKKSCSPAQK